MNKKAEGADPKHKCVLGQSLFFSAPVTFIITSRFLDILQEEKKLSPAETRYVLDKKGADP
ncbi:hypothetical protein P9711_01500, partial [Anoxybacillus geothermalis]|nr:hypothetical protein [Anoxybacillus geothermalis]